MVQLKYYDDDVSEWLPMVTGIPGEKGDSGVGVPAGGTTGQALVKDSSSDYDTTWGTIPTTFDDLSDGITNKAFTSSEKTKLSGIATNATANDTDANLKNRANHTGTQTASTISDFESSVSANSDVTANTAARHSHSNKSILDNTTAPYTTAEQSKLSGIAAGAQVNTVTSVASKTGAVTLVKGDVGLGSVDDTSNATERAAAATLANKRINPRVLSSASASSVTPTIATYDIYMYTALAANLTINAPGGSPVNGNKLLFAIKDNGTTRTLTWNADFAAAGVAIPTATTAGKWHHVGFIYNATAAKWFCIAATVEA